MRCIFCKNESKISKSIEHIIPESLYNTSHVLPKGIVCDLCNNYFSREVEKPFLDSSALTNLRFMQSIPNKRGRVPPAKGFILTNTLIPVHLHREASDSPFSIELSSSVAGLTNIRHGKLIFPLSAASPSKRVTARFLAKTAIEAFALRLLAASESIDYLVDEQQLDSLRNFARKGQPNEWPFYSRTIYEADRCIIENGKKLQTAHEFDFLATRNNQTYFSLVIFGLELTINVEEREIDGYITWLKENNNQSHLYTGKNSPT